MRLFKIEEVIEIPSNVKVEVENNKIKVRGPKGELERVIDYPNIKVLVENNKLRLVSYFATRREKRILYTWASHIENMIKGVTEGFVYKLKAVYVHFPFKMKVQGDTFIIENFLGEKAPRKITIPKGIKVRVDGDYVIVEGVDIEKVGNFAGILEQMTSIPGKDPRKFQDGLYIIEKPYTKYITE